MRRSARAARPDATRARSLPAFPPLLPYPARSLPGARDGSGLHDNRIGELIVQTLAGLAENQQCVHQPEDVADHGNETQHGADHIAQPENPSERGRGAVAAHDLDTRDSLADALAIA